MKKAAQDGNLKASDIVRADRIPGFATNLLRTTLRITQSGWAECLVSTLASKRGAIEMSIEHRFTPPELNFISGALETLSPVAKPITWDDVPIQRLLFRTGSGEKSLEILEYDPLNVSCQKHSSDFTEIWNYIHLPFRDFISHQIDKSNTTL